MMDYKFMKALVTGGTGFIGSHVVDLLLEKGHSVRLFTRKKNLPEKFEGKTIETFQGDLENFGSVVEAMKDIEVFFHIGEIKNNTKAASEKNVKLMERIIENLEVKKVRRFVFISSITAAGIPSEIPANEDAIPETILNDHYTSYKRRCEKIITERAKGVEFAIIRPAPVYGPGSRYLERLIRTLKRIGRFGFPFSGNARNLAPLIYVKDLAGAIYLSGIKSEAAGHVFNITDGLRHTWLDFFNAVSEALNIKFRIVPLPPLLLQFPSAFFDLFSGIFGIDLNLYNYTTYFSRDIYFDNSKARNLLGWQPEYSLNEGVKEMLRDFIFSDSKSL